MSSRLLKHFFEEHFFGLTILATVIFVIGMGTYMVFIVFIDEPIEYMVVVGKTHCEGYGIEPCRCKR